MIDQLQLIVNKKNPLTSNCKDFIPLVVKVKPNMVDTRQDIENIQILKLKHGDSFTFSSIFSIYYNDLVLFATRITKDLYIAEDIVQDIFVNLWEDRTSLKISVSLKSYLLKAVKNRCIDWYRHNKIIQKHSDFVSGQSIMLDYDTDSYLLYSELQGKIDTALAMIPTEFSEAFRMSRYNGLKYHEIAKLLDVSVRTIEVRISKALHLIRDHLKEYFLILIIILSNVFTRGF